MPADGRQFIIPSQPFANYPGVGAAAVTVLSMTIEQGLAAVVNFLAIQHFGGGFVDGSGNVIWRVLINGGAMKGLHALTSQIGTFAQPNPIYIPLIENDVLQVTAEVPAGAANPPPPGTTTAARFHGWTYPIQKRITQAQPPFAVPAP